MKKRILASPKRLEFKDKEEQLRELECTSKVVKGRCCRCNNAFVWAKGKLKLKDARCPGCGDWLTMTVWYLKSVPWYRCDVVEVK